MAENIALKFSSASRTNTISKIDCGTSTPRLSGTVDVGCYLNLTELRCVGNDITTVGLVSSLEVLNLRDNALGAPTPFRVLGGFFPNINSCESLQYCDLGQNHFQPIASIPDLTVNTELQVFKCDNNQIQTWSGDVNSITPNLGRFEAQFNLLTTETVDGILSAFDAANRNSSGGKECILYLHEVGNNPPGFSGGILLTADGAGFSQTGNTVTFSYPEGTPLYDRCHGLEDGWLITVTDLSVPSMTGTAVVTVPNLSSFSYDVVDSANITSATGIASIRTTLNSLDGYRRYQHLALPLNQTYNGVQGKQWDVRINQPFAEPEIIHCGYVDYIDGQYPPGI